MRQAAQKQQKAEKAREWSTNYVIFAHKNNYTEQSGFCKCFFPDFFATEAQRHKDLEII